MDSSTEITFGAWLRLRRRQLDLTQSDLANRVGCSVMMIRKIEAGERRPSRQMASLMAAALEVPEVQREDFIRVARQSIFVSPAAMPGESEAIPPLPGAHGGLAEPGSGPVSPAKPSLALPHYPGLFVGRGAELEQVVHLLAGGECRLLTLTGPGGIGKTRLAVEAAQAFDLQSEPVFPQGVVYISLAPLNSPELIAPALASALGFSFHEGADPLGQLIAFLHDQRVLIVLDNFEHLLGGAGLVAELLARTPAVSLLVTSRQRLALSGEWVLEISGLAYPPGMMSSDCDGLAGEYSAVQLFLESARRAHQGFEIQPGAAPAVQQICQLVDGMPLGIELAAAWLRLLSPEEVAQEIQRSADFLASSARDLPERHQSLRATFEHSWNLLAPDEQAAFARLAVFRGGFERQAAAAVAGAGLPVLASLLDKSLLRREGNRYTIHELLRQYAEAKLAEDPALLAATRQAHAETFTDRLAAWEPQIRGHGQVQALLEMDAEVDNLRTAWQWLVERASAVDTAGIARLQRAWFSLWFYWETRYFYQEGKALFDALVQALEPGEQPEASQLQATGRLCCGWFEMRRLQAEPARLALERGLAALAHYPQNPASVFGLLPLAFIQMRQGDAAGCRQLLEQAHQRAAELDDRWLQAVSGHELCNLFTYTGDYDLALQSGQQTLLLAEELGEPRRRMITSYYLASLHIRLDDLALARDYLERAQRLAQETGDIRYQAHVLRVRTDYYLARGDVNAAAEDAARALEFSQRIGDPMVLFAGQINAGRVEQWAGNLLDAAHYFMQAYRLGRQYGLFSMQTNALLYLAETAWKYGSHAEAAALALRLEPEVQADLELARIAARLRQAAQERFTPEFLEKLAAEAGHASLEALLARLSLAA